MVSGTGNYWPFLYQGVEKDPYDPGPLYYSGGGQFYSPQLVRSLSETGQTSSSGPGGPPPTQLAYGPGSEGNGSFGHWYTNQLEGNLTNPDGGFDIGVSTSETSYVIPVGAIIQIIEEWISFFEWLLGGSSAPPTPRQLYHGRHPLYGQILGISPSLAPTEASTANVPDPSDPSHPCPSCHCGCEHCHTETMLVTAYDNDFASTGKRPGDPGYGITSSGTHTGIGTIAAPNRFSYFTGMYVPGYGCGTVLDRGGSIRGKHIDVWLPPPLSTEWGARSGVMVEVCDDNA